MNGESRLGDTLDGRLDVGDWWVLADHFEEGGVRWDVERWDGERWAEPGDVAITVGLNLGEIRPLQTGGIATDGTFELGGDATTGYTVRQEGRPATINWKFSESGHSCIWVECDGPDQANRSRVAFNGHTQDMRKWTPEEFERFHGYWSLTNIEWVSFPSFGREMRTVTDEAGNTSEVEVTYWVLHMGNPHLDVNGQPVVGSYRSYVPPNLLAALGTTVEEAVATGLDVRRIEGDTQEQLEASVTAAGDGGVIFDIPAIGFSEPTIKVSRVVEAEVQQPEDPEPTDLAPSRVRVRPMDGALTVRFDAPVRTEGDPITGYTVSCSSEVTRIDVPAPAAVAVDLRPTTNGVPWSCTVGATDAGGLQAWSDPVHGVPQEGLGPFRPGASPKLSARATATGGLRITWAKPLSTGNATIRTYKVIVCPARQSRCPGREKVVRTSDDRTVVIRSGALDWKRSRIVVRAINKVGGGTAARTVVSHR